MDGPTLVSGEYDFSGLTHRLDALVKQTGARPCIIDSATALFSPRPPAGRAAQPLLPARIRVAHNRRHSVILAEAPSDYGQLTTMGVEDYVCDLTIILRNIVDGGRRRRSIEVNKYRRSAHYKGEYPCAITTRGLAVFPLDAQEPHDTGKDVERYPSGVRVSTR